MRRAPSPRQIDVFRAMIELGAVSRAADALGVSQPAASKLLAHLEADSGLRLFDRARGRLVPTTAGLRLYEEIEKVFAGIRQIERAIDVLHRREQERLTVGVIPALAGFIAPVVRSFLAHHPDIAMTLDVRGSRHIAEWIASRRVDIGVISERIELPSLRSETILRRALVCIAPPGDPIADRQVVTPADLMDRPLIGYSTLNETRQLVHAMFRDAAVPGRQRPEGRDDALEPRDDGPRFLLETTTAQMMCECVAAGAGIGIVHPVVLAGLGNRVITRPLEPALTVGYQLCRFTSDRSNELVESFCEELARAARVW